MIKNMKYREFLMFLAAHKFRQVKAEGHLKFIHTPTGKIFRLPNHRGDVDRNYLREVNRILEGKGR